MGFPDELLHLVLAELLYYFDYDMFSLRSPAQLLERAEATTLPLVCHRWRRVLVPIILETVILNSELETKTFVSMLRLKNVGPYISAALSNSKVLLPHLYLTHTRVRILEKSK